MSDKEDKGPGDFPKIGFEKKSFRKIRTCRKCEIIIIVLEQLIFWGGELWVFGLCPWCQGFVYKRKKEDGDEWLALSN